MRKFLLCLLTLALFVFLISSCRSSRQADVSVNAANASETTRNSGKEQPKTESAAAAPEKETAEARGKSSPDAEKRADSSGGGSSGEKFENRCGWFENPTPANAWLTDRDGEWIIGVQGGHQAEGDHPEFADDQWVKTNVNYGYGCACLRVRVDYKTHRVLEIASATAKPLSACRNDPALKEPSR